MTQWNSLFCSLNTDIESALKQSLENLDYTLYHAFDLVPGKSYPDTLKTFIMPSNTQWTQILVDDETELEDLETLAEALSARGTVLLTQLDMSEGALDVYQQGEVVDDLVEALEPYLLDGKSADDMEQALDVKLPLPMIDPELDEQDQILAINDLPDDIRNMTAGMNMGRAQKMFQRMTGNLMGRGQAQDAQNMLNSDKLDWNSEGGLFVRGVLSCLIQGDGWMSPDFPTVRDAYQRHVRKERRPNAKLYPGDQQMMDAVPNALDYVPVYGGMD